MLATVLLTVLSGRQRSPVRSPSGQPRLARRVEEADRIGINHDGRRLSDPRRIGIEPQIAFDSEDVIIAAAMVASGDGICLVPASLTNLHVPHLAYRRLNARGDATMDLYCMSLDGTDHPLLAAFRSNLSIESPVDIKGRRQKPIGQQTSAPRRSR